MARAPRSKSSKPATKAPADMMRELAFYDPLQLFRLSGFTEYNPSQLVSQRGLDIFDEMLRDDQIKAAYSFKRYAILASGWTIQSPPDKPEDWEVSEFVRRRLDDINCTVEHVLHSVLSAMAYGYSVSELVYKPIDTGPDRGRVGLKAVKTKKPHDFAFKIDEFGNIIDDGLVQEGRPDGEDLPRQKFIHWTYGDDFGNPYGKSDLEAVYRAWWTSDNAYKWLAMLLERFGIPPIVALYDPNTMQAPQIAELRKVLTNIRNSTAAAIPRGNKDSFELWSPELGGQVSSVFVPALQMLKQDIARGMLMPGFLGITPDAVGSYARAKVIFDVFLLSARFVQSCLEDSVMHEQVIKPLIDLNFNVDAYPRFKFKSMTDAAQGELLQTWATLLDNKAVMPGPDDEAHIRGLVEFPPQGDPENEDRKLKPADITPELLESGVLTVNEVRGALGLPPLPDGDVPVNAQIAGGLRNDRVQRGAPASQPQNGQAPEDADEPEDDEEKPGKGEAKLAEEAPAQSPMELTAAERRADFAAIETTITAVENEMIADLSALIKIAVERTLDRWLKDEPGFERIATWRLALPQRARADAVARLVQAFDRGRGDLRREVQAVEMREGDANYTPVDALAFLEVRGSTIVERIHGQLTDFMREELLFSLKNGIPFRETVKRIREKAEADWLEMPFARPSRLETIVRTVTTEAYNQGRLVMARQPGMAQLVPAMQYSAVLDDRTTPTCRFLHGKIFRIDDPELDRLTPPNHYRCRSILLPITLDIAPASDEYITRTQIDEATKLADPKFGGER